MCTYVALFVLFGFVVFVKIMFIGCQHLAPGSPSTPILQFLILDLVKGRESRLSGGVGGVCVRKAQKGSARTDFQSSQ